MARYEQYDIAEIEALFRRVEELESRVAALEGGPSGRSGTDFRDAASVADRQVDSEISNLLSQGRLIEAIKVYREHTGVSLSEAKAAIEQRRGPFGWPPSRARRVSPAAGRC